MPDARSSMPMIPPLRPCAKAKATAPPKVWLQARHDRRASGRFHLCLHLPVGHPSDASHVEPSSTTLEQAIARSPGRAPPRPSTRVAGDLALNDAALREALHGSVATSIFRG